ncbi:MAG: Smr/MutS family protein [Candidatus Paceibacterota bacterium]
MAQIRKKDKYAHLVQPRQEWDFHDLGEDINPQTIMSRTLRAIMDAKQQSFPTIKIITGRGIHSKNGPVIKPIVLKYLDMLQKQKVIKSYKFDTAFGSGPNDGAIIVKIS